MKIINKGNFGLALKELKNDKNNCVASLFNEPESANDGVLENAVFTVKSNYATIDGASSGSSKLLENFNPHYNATAFEKLIKAGAVPVAKVHCDELALGGTGLHSGYGIVKNPIDKTRLAGGSSSGSIATLTKNVSFALASDSGDSVRLPASFLGKVGFKPSYGAISRYGLFTYASSLDTVAYFSHNINDTAAISQVLFGKDPKDMTSVDVKIDSIKKTKPKKIGVLNVDYLEDFVQEEFDEFKNKLSNEVDVEVIEPNHELLNLIKVVYEIISYGEASSSLSNLNGIAFGNRREGENWDEVMTSTRSKLLGPNVQLRLTFGSFFLHSKNQEDTLIKAQKVRRLIKEYYESLHSKYDLVIYPAYANVAPFIDSKKNKKYGYMDYILTGGNLAGNPSLTIPWIKKDKLFVNLAVDAKLYSDEKMLSYALWLEEFLGGQNAR